jgi:hypothetical protein
MKLVDLTGKRFGRLVVLSKAPRTYQTMWDCACDCGACLCASGSNLRSGHTASCGCLREELRPTYAKKRNYTGLNNPRAKASAARSGGNYVPSDSVWYKRAAGVFYAAKKKGVKLGFLNVAELASYVVSVKPDRCPVFNRRFVERGAGFSSWSPSIDKIDPKKGYVRGNIQVMSMLANCMKRDASPEQLKQFARWVLKEKQ